ncbi:MAG: hypothetical protein D6711_18880 [Chloroflexi bacterium]|nr:MAG: hypothetical protein D6711_18880 [Chloroflexota bacterium]
MRHILIALGIILITTGLQLTPPDEIGLPYGATVSGQINDDTPRNRYYFDALRCDFISIRVITTQGTLDPVISVIDSDNNLLHWQDDYNGSGNAVIETLGMPATGRYYIIVSRFGYELGQTSGEYQITIDRIGNGSDPNCAMRYGDTVFYTITNDAPFAVYSFRARQGDIINIEMRRRSGDLDAYLELLNADGIVMDANDDVLGQGTKNAAIQSFVIPQDGIYYIYATRYGFEAGTTTGNFSLVLQEAANSGLGNSPLAAIPISTNAIQEGTLNPQLNAQYYRFQASKDDLITITLTPLGGNGDITLALTNDSLQPIVTSNTIENFLIPTDGEYYLVISGTNGRYRLSIQNDGNAFANVPNDIRRITYGTSITGNIDDTTPQVTYAFWGEAGDTIRITMDRSEGNLDPYLTILAADGNTVLVVDDDSGVNQNARIERYTLPQTGVYFIRASRFEGEANPNTIGSYVLVLARIFD